MMNNMIADLPNTIYRCLICGCTVEGDGHGTLIWCPCGNLGLDDNGYYARILYKTKHYEVIRDWYAGIKNEKGNIRKNNDR